MENRLKGMVAGAAGTVAVALKGVGAAAQNAGGGGNDGNDVAAAGNGGTADASANGGVVVIDEVNSGGNSGGSIAVGDVGTPDMVVFDKYGKPVYVEGSDGAVAIDGGDVTTSTSLDLSADGGVAIADASGGDGNFAFVS